MDITIAGAGECNFYAAIVPKKMVKEVMAAYAMRPGVQETDVLRRWTMTPGEGEVKGYIILTAYVEGQGPQAFATRLLRRTIGEFGMHRAMPWGWRQIEYENTGLKHGVKCDGGYAPISAIDESARHLMQYLADKFSVSVYINGM